MCDIILATISSPTFIAFFGPYKWTHKILQINYIDFVDSIVSKCTSLHTVAIDDNDNGFMAALSMAKTQNEYDLVCAYNY